MTPYERQVEQMVEEAASSRYPARELFKLEELGHLGGGEAEKILIERFEGTINYGIELERLLLDTDRKLDEANAKLRHAELAYAMRRVA